MKTYEIITKTLVTKIYRVEAGNEQEARHLLADPAEEPDVEHHDYEEVVGVTEIKN
jgi:hypothetical protein